MTTQNQIEQPGVFALAGANANITSMTGLTGQIAAPTFINDSSGNHLLSFNYIGSAVNYFRIYNNITSASPIFDVTGSDAAVNMQLQTKNGNFLLVDSTHTIAPALYFANAANTFYTGLKAATNQATTVTFTLPTADAAGVMQSDGSGNLSLGALDLTSTKVTAAFSDISGTVTVTGFSGTPTVVFRQCVIGKIVYITFSITGTSNATTFTVTGMPKTSNVGWYAAILITNAGTNAIGLVQMAASATTLAFDATPAGGAFTNSGTKSAYGNIFYEST